jgi:hypothetical protein
MRLKWKLVSVLSDIVLIWTYDKCTVCVEHTIGSKIGDVDDVESLFYPFGDNISVGGR